MTLGTIRQAIADAAALLSGDAHLRDNAHRDAELLLLHTLALTKATLLAHPESTLTPEPAPLPSP